jgi:RNA polymerase sigma-70 factor (ECF subfamily)
MPANHPVPQFEILVRQHLSAMRAVVHRVLAKRTPGDVDDVCQVTIEKCRRSFRPELAASFRYWFLRAGRNNAISALRQVSRMTPVDEIFESAEPANGRDEPGALEILELRETRRRIDEAIEAAIPDRTHRTIFRLRHFEDLPYREIAEECGVPIGTVMSSLHRSKERLRDYLAPRRAEFESFLAA